MPFDIQRSPLLHHISFPVSDLPEAKAFYGAVLGALGYRIVAESSGFVGFGLVDDEDKFALILAEPAVAAGRGFHLAFAAPSQEAVDRFHRAALAHGATDNGPPGLRPDYGPTYYAAFVIDLDGHRIEAVHK
jgi:catechol 2,3-dioxygenase-like lactoylglutathione lyase family enzyme